MGLLIIYLCGMTYHWIKYFLITIILLYFKCAIAGTGTARDVNYLIAVIIILLSIVLGIAFLTSYIHNYFKRKGLEENSLNDVPSKNEINCDDDNYFSNHI